MRTLIADDDPLYLTLLEDLLARWGHDVVATRDGREAWDAWKGSDDIPLMLLDWMMPQMDGYELCRTIRADGPDADTPYIILITGSRGEKDLMRVLVAGADDYLIKPFQPSDLQVRLRAAQRIMDLRDQVARLQAELAGTNLLTGADHQRSCT